jgi:uncharacterized membrane protein YdjX (TVP38/TMEM64 family)
VNRTLRIVIAVAAWVALVVAWVAYQRSTGLGSLDTAQRLVDEARGNWWAFGAFAAVSLLRPLVLFPATVLTVAAGLLFGPVVGVIVAAVGANGAAWLAYMIGRSFRRPAADDAVQEQLGHRWAERLRSNGFEAVLLLRLLFLPYDLVSYACGLLLVPLRQFLAANVIGTLPGTVAFVLVGASVTRLDDGIGGVDPVMLAVSIALVAASITASQVLKRTRAGSR